MALSWGNTFFSPIQIWTWVVWSGRTSIHLHGMSMTGTSNHGKSFRINRRKKSWCSQPWIQRLPCHQRITSNSTPEVNAVFRYSPSQKWSKPITYIYIYINEYWNVDVYLINVLPQKHVPPPQTLCNHILLTVRLKSQQSASMTSCSSTDAS